MLTISLTQAPDKIDRLIKHALSREVTTALPNIELRGNNLAAQTNHDPEMVLVGAAGTGKTLANLVYINQTMWDYPRLRVLTIRKVRADLAESVLVTYERDVLGYENPICAGVQREHRHAYRYPNGSIMVLGGMDRPGKVLSAEYDIIYVPETVQLTDNDLEMLSMRLARDGNFPFPQLRGDTNPDIPTHWLKKRGDDGKTTLMYSFHEDNPAYWDLQAGDWTPAGRRYVLGRLENLSGVRRERYRYGRWVLAEGAIYDEWSDAIHVIKAFDIPKEWQRFRSIDFGFTKPFSCSWWAVDHDGRMYLYRQIYKTKVLVEDHASEILRLTAGKTSAEWEEITKKYQSDPAKLVYIRQQLADQNEKISYTVTDHDAEDNATLKKHGIPITIARKAISVGIQAVQSRLKVQPDGKPRLMIFEDALAEQDQELAEAKQPTCTKDEFPAYVWKNKSKKEEPVDEYNHGLDEARYAVMSVDNPDANSVQSIQFAGLYPTRISSRSPDPDSRRRKR